MGVPVRLNISTRRIRVCMSLPPHSNTGIGAVLGESKEVHRDRKPTVAIAGGSTLVVLWGTWRSLISVEGSLVSLNIVTNSRCHRRDGFHCLSPSPGLMELRTRSRPSPLLSPAWSFRQFRHGGVVRRGIADAHGRATISHFPSLPPSQEVSRIVSSHPTDF